MAYRFIGRLFFSLYQAHTHIQNKDTFHYKLLHSSPSQCDRRRFSGIEANFRAGKRHFAIN